MREVSADVTLRLAEQSDFEKFFALKSEQTNIYWSGYSAPPDRNDLHNWFIKNLSGSGHREILLGCIDDRVCGYLYLDAGSEAFDISIGVSEDFRSMGIASKMLERARQYVRQEKECQRINAWIYDDNAASIRAFERAGFTKCMDVNPRTVPRPDTMATSLQSLWCVVKA